MGTFCKKKGYNIIYGGDYHHLILNNSHKVLTFSSNENVFMKFLTFSYRFDNTE